MRAEEERRKTEEEKKKLEEEKKKLEEEWKKAEEEKKKLEDEKKLLVAIRTLDGIRLRFSDGGGIKREGNRILRDGGYAPHCFIGEELKVVCSLLIVMRYKNLLYVWMNAVC